MPCRAILTRSHVLGRSQNITPGTAGCSDERQETKVRMTSIVLFCRDEEGLTTVEYAIAGALLSSALIAAFTALGAQVGGVIDTLTAALASVG